MKCIFITPNRACPPPGRYAASPSNLNDRDILSRRWYLSSELVIIAHVFVVFLLVIRRTVAIITGDLRGKVSAARLADCYAYA
ncbi:hypothetical protein BV898_07814 [Hypsibius exemplaris]|uniref:Uncharacterized protein n=1 Tax=Hypsibius exemplaris TaxID=2072580 RepID=A0A1W0WSR1_HYPEX|nr:hypothetical protein BV898_07814 [Hypsibius exemplaris]